LGHEELGDAVNDQEAADIAVIRPLHGLYLGMLSKEELAALQRLTLSGWAGRDYSGLGAILGLGKVRFIEQETPR
jgi:hypothetical protein